MRTPVIPEFKMLLFDILMQKDSTRVSGNLMTLLIDNGKTINSAFSYDGHNEAEWKSICFEAYSYYSNSQVFFILYHVFIESIN